MCSHACASPEHFRAARTRCILAPEHPSNHCGLVCDISLMPCIQSSCWSLLGFKSMAFCPPPGPSIRSPAAESERLICTQSWAGFVLRQVLGRHRYWQYLQRSERWDIAAAGLHVLRSCLQLPAGRPANWSIRVQIKKQERRLWKNGILRISSDMHQLEKGSLVLLSDKPCPVAARDFLRLCN